MFFPGFPWIFLGFPYVGVSSSSPGEASRDCCGQGVRNGGYPTIGWLRGCSWGYYVVIVIVVIKGWLYHVIPLLVIGLIVGSFRFPGVVACHIVTIVITPTSPERTPLTVVVYPLISPELPQVGIERGITSRNSWNEFCLQYIQVFLEQFQLDDVQEGIILNLIHSHNCNWFLGGWCPFSLHPRFWGTQQNALDSLDVLKWTLLDFEGESFHLSAWPSQVVTQLAERAEGAEAEVKTLAEKTLGCGEDGEIIRDFHGDVERNGEIIPWKHMKIHSQWDIYIL